MSLKSFLVDMVYYFCCIYSLNLKVKENYSDIPPNWTQSLYQNPLNTEHGLFTNPHIPIKITPFKPETLLNQTFMSDPEGVWFREVSLYTNGTLNLDSYCVVLSGTGMFHRDLIQCVLFVTRHWETVTLVLI